MDNDDFRYESNRKIFSDGELIEGSNLNKDQQTVVEVLGDEWTNI